MKRFTSKKEIELYSYQVYEVRKKVNEIRCKEMSSRWTTDEEEQASDERISLIDEEIDQYLKYAIEGLDKLATQYE